MAEKHVQCATPRNKTSRLGFIPSISGNIVIIIGFTAHISLWKRHLAASYSQHNNFLPQLITWLVAYMHIKIILRTYLYINVFSLSLLYTLYLTKLYYILLYYHSWVISPSYHHPNTFPRDVMHHARIDHHSRSIGRRKFEGGLPLRAALLVQGPVDLVQSDPWSWRTPQETTRLATENGSFTGNNGDFTNKYMGNYGGYNSWYSWCLFAKLVYH